jgi:hypothetical protein
LGIKQAVFDAGDLGIEQRGSIREILGTRFCPFRQLFLVAG